MKTLISILTVLLLGSNAYWLFALIDTGVTLTHRDQHIRDLKEANKELSQMIPMLIKSKSKAEIVEIVSNLTAEEPFEKDGCIWIGRVGLKFSVSGELLSVSKTWNTGEVDPCFPAF